MTANEVKALLQKRYSPPEYAFFTEVAASTGSTNSYCDGIAFHLWPSSGHPLYGFEIKVSRSDWLHELKQPAKPVVMQYCDKWWLVAPKGVAKVEELPKAWGFLEIVNNKFYVRKQAPDLTPIPLTLGFIAALLRRATEKTVPRSTLYAQVKQARDEARVEFSQEIERSKADLESYKQRVREWEDAAGLRVFSSGWGPTERELGKVVRWVLEGGLKRSMTYQADSAIKGLTELLARLKHFDEMAKEFPDFPSEVRNAAHHH